MRVLVSAVALVIFISLHAVGQDGMSGRFARIPGYARSPERGTSGTYPIATYVPSMMLLFDVDPDEPRAGHFENYAGVTTQDGARIWVVAEGEDRILSRGTLEQARAIRNDTLKEVVVFHDRTKLCLKKLCDLEGEQSLLYTVNPGALGAISKTEDSDLLKIEFQEIELITTYSTLSNLQNLKKDGLATSLRERFPRYAVDIYDSSLFRTACTKTETLTLDITDQSENVDLEKEQTIARLFKLGTIQMDQNRVISLRDIGHEEEAWQFRLYSFSEPRQDADSATASPFSEGLFGALIIYQCQPNGLDYRNVLIKSVELKTNPDNESVILNSFGTPDTLRGTSEHSIDYIKDPYLWSVNSDKQYFALLRRLSNQYFDGNRARSGYFLTQFNRSCTSEHRRSPDCTSHRYDP